MKDYFKKLILILIFLSLFIPLKQAYAIFGISEDLWGWNEMALDALDFWDTTILRFFWNILLLVLGSLAFLFISSRIFDWTLRIPINLGVMDPSKNQMVWAGWNFIRGLSNIFLILILVVIALAYILKIETFATKKALPKLIIVALLINFSLVFVGILVDLTQIPMNGIIKALGTDVPSLVSPIELNLVWLAGFYVGYFLLYLATATIPLGNVAFILGSLFLLFTGIFLVFILQSLVFIIFGFFLGMLFFTLSAMFILRIGVIWVLAILSPIALMCWILPQTKKYWDQWIGLLSQWLIWGVIAVLFTGLVVKLAGFLPTLPEPLKIKILGVEIPLFPPALYQYLFLLVFLAIVYYFTTKKFAPEMAGFLISSATGIIRRGAPMVGAPLKQGAERWMARGAKKEEEFKEKAKRGEIKKVPLRAKLGAVPAKLYARTTGVSPSVTIEKDIEREAENLEKRFGENVDDAISQYAPKFVRGRFIGPRREEIAALGLYVQKIKGREGVDKLNIEQKREIAKAIADSHPGRLKDFVKYAPELVRDKEIGELIINRLNPKGVGDEAVKTIAQRREMIGTITAANALREIEVRGITDVTKKAYDELRARAVEFKLQQALKRDDADKYTREAVIKPEFLESVARYGNREFTRRLLETGKLDWKELKETVEKIGVREVARSNPYVLKFPYSPPGRLIGAEKFAVPEAPTKPASEEDIAELIAEVRKERAAKKDIDELVERVIAAVRGVLSVAPRTPPGRPEAPPTRPPGRP